MASEKKKIKWVDGAGSGVIIHHTSVTKTVSKRELFFEKF